jgi:hypothetical protein
MFLFIKIILISGGAMLAIVKSTVLHGLDGQIVEVEVDVSRGLPCFDIVGLPDASVRESKDRVRSAIKNSGFEFPVKRITVNLAPADLKKEGPIYDLPVAVGILAATGQLPQERCGLFVYLGELSLNGSLKPVTGVLPNVLTAREYSLNEVVVPLENVKEAALVEGVNAYAAGSLAQLSEFLSGVIAVLAGVIFFPIQSVNAASTSEGVWSQIAAIAFDIIPSNIFKSFLDGNTLQTIFLAVITGIAMLTMKGRFPVLTKVITELNLVLSTLLDAVCSLMPWVIFICIFNMLLSGDSRALLSSLGVVVIICVCFVVFVLLCLLSVAVIEKNNPVDYIRTIGPVLLIALSTASSSATFASHTNTASIKQGIRDYLVNFSIPVGALFSKPFVVPVLFLMTLFVGNFYGTNFGMADILSA